jgi:hypothetical protein
VAVVALALALAPSLGACGGDESEDGGASGASTGGTNTGGSSGNGSAGAGSGAGGTSSAGTGGGAAGAPSGGASSGGASAGGADGGGAANGGAGAGAGGGGGGPIGVGCPANAAFCADFESDELPSGATYVSDSASTNWLDDFAIDHTTAAVGSASLEVKSNTEAQSGGVHQMLVVPSGSNTFWVRFHIRSDQMLGQDARNAFVVATAGNGISDQPALEFSEDCGIALVSSEGRLRPDGSTQAIPCMTPLRLLPDTWYCVELSINGASGDTQLYVDGELKIDARGWTPGKGAFEHVKFGAIHLNPVTRTIWYDEFGVAPSRLGCPGQP